MAVINFARREIEVKVVYYGPAFSGKTTNVQVLHGLFPADQRGDLHTMATAEERTLFFDYVPVYLGQIAGFNAKFKLFTVPGQVVYKETRKVVLQGADAVVFVADSAYGRANANIDAVIDLEENLRAQGRDLASIPLVFQFNKRDLADARPTSDLAADLNPFGVPMFEAVAFEGKGVMEAMRAVTDLAAQRLRDNLAGRETAVTLTAVDRALPESDQQVIREHLEKIKRVRPMEDQRAQSLRSSGAVSAADVDAFLHANVDRADEFLNSLDDGVGAEVSPTEEVPKPVVRLPVVLAPLLEPAAVRDALPAQGNPIEAAVDSAGWGGARVDQVVGARLHGGAVFVDVVIDRGGERRTHAVKLVTRPPTPAAQPSGPGLFGVVGAAVVAGGVGVMIGTMIGIAVAGR